MFLIGVAVKTMEGAVLGFILPKPEKKGIVKFENRMDAVAEIARRERQFGDTMSDDIQPLWENEVKGLAAQLGFSIPLSPIKVMYDLLQTNDNGSVSLADNGDE